MRGAHGMVGLMACVVLLIAVGGCVSLDEHRRCQAANRNLQAEKQALTQELFDARNVGDSLRTRVNSLEGEMGTKDELLGNLRQENELLDEMYRTMQGSLEGAANTQTLGNITIPKLPAPLDTALKRFADEHPTAVEYNAARGTVKWKADLLFPLGSDVVMESSMEGLRSFAEIIKSPAAADFEVIVVGHTDNTPIVKSATKANHPTNWHLSGHRAIAVGDVLVKSGYSAQRIGVAGYGEYRPIVDNSTEPNKAKNRRVEIYLIPRGAIVATATDTGRSIEGEAMAFVPMPD